MVFFCDEDIIKGIRQHKRDVLEYIYGHYYETVKWFIIKGKNFNEEDAKDIFQDTMVVIYQNTLKEGFNIKYSFKTYFHAIIKNMVYLRLHMLSRIGFINDFKVDEVPDDGNDIPITDDIILDRDMLSEMKRGLFWKKFNELPDDCRRILRMFFDKIPLSKIAEIMEYKSENYAKKRKHMCKEFLKKSIKEDNFYKMIKEYESN